MSDKEENKSIDSIKGKAVCEKFISDFNQLLKSATIHPDIFSMKDDKEKMASRIYIGCHAIRVAAGMMLASVPDEAAEHFIALALVEARDMNVTVKEAASMLELLLEGKKP